MNHMTIRKKRKEVKKRLGFMTALWMALLSLCLAACGRNSVRRTRQENSPQAECEESQADHMEAEESCLSGEMTEPLKDFYSNLGKLTVVEGQEDVEDTTKLVFAALED